MRRYRMNYIKHENRALLWTVSRCSLTYLTACSCDGFVNELQRSLLWTDPSVWLLRYWTFLSVFLINCAEVLSDLRMDLTEIHDNLFRTSVLPIHVIAAFFWQFSGISGGCKACTVSCPIIRSCQPQQYFFSGFCRKFDCKFLWCLLVLQCENSAFF